MPLTPKMARNAQRRLVADRALQTALEPLMTAPVERYKGGGTYVQPGEKRIRLMGADSRPTAAGVVYYKRLLNVAAPTLYDSNQPLDLDKFVTARDGSKLLFRRRGANGEWIVTKKGEDYFRYHRTLFVPRAPFVLLKLGAIDGEDNMLYAANTRPGEYMGIPGQTAYDRRQDETG